MSRLQAIDKICENFANDHFIRIIPLDEQTIKRWEADHMAYLHEGFFSEMKRGLA